MIVEEPRDQSESNSDLAPDVPVNSKAMFIELWDAIPLQNILADKRSRTFRTLCLMSQEPRDILCINSSRFVSNL